MFRDQSLLIQIYEFAEIYIYNDPSSSNVGVGDDSGCQPSNPTCNLTQLNADNAIGSVVPEMINPAAGDFRPTSNE